MQRANNNEGPTDTNTDRPTTSILKDTPYAGQRRGCLLAQIRHLSTEGDPVIRSFSENYLLFTFFRSVKNVQADERVKTNT